MVLFTLCKMYIFIFSSLTPLTLWQLLQLYCTSFTVHRFKQEMSFTAATHIRAKNQFSEFQKNLQASSQSCLRWLFQLNISEIHRQLSWHMEKSANWVFSIIKHSHWYKSWKCAYQLFIVRLQLNLSLWKKNSLKVELLHIGYIGIIITLKWKSESTAFLFAGCNWASLHTSVIFKNSSCFYNNPLLIFFNFLLH